MPHVLKLGFSQNPSGSADYIDLGGGQNTSNGSVGYHLLTYSEGTARVDQYGRMVRDLTITCEVRGSTVADSYFKFTEINRYLQRTRMYFEHYSGNIPAQTDLQWHTGRAATLSFQGQNQSKMVYWDVLDGQATLPPGTLLGPNNQGFLISPVTIKITVNYCNREAAVILDNPFPMGDFEPPWKITTTTSDPAGGGWNTNASHTLDTTTFKFGTRSLKWSGTGGGSWVTPTITFPEDCTVVLSIWSKGTVVGGSGNYTINRTKNGSSATLWSWTAGHNDAGWTQYSSAPIAITAGDTLFMTGAATGGGGTVFGLNFDGVACFRNPTGSVAPTEFFATGRSFAIPTGNTYGIRGDVEAPFVMSLNYLKRAGAPTDNNPRFFFLGINPIKWGVDYPLLGLDLQTANGAADTSLFWGAVGNSVTGSPITGTTNFALTGPSIGKTVSSRSRKYRAILNFAAYTAVSAGIIASSVTITLGKEVRTYSAELHTTPGMAASGTPMSLNYGFYDLGDFIFPRPGGIGIERSLILSTNDNVAVNFTGGVGTRFFLGGVILIPAEQFVYIDLGTNIGSNAYNPLLSNESSSVNVQLAQQNTGTTISTYQAAGILSDLNSFNISAFFTADSVELEPGDTHFEMLAFQAFQNNISTGNPLTGYYFWYDYFSLQPTLIYAPRNLTAAV